MRPNQLLLRCFAEREDGLWVAYCLDLSLAAQGDSLEEVRHKLELQVREYVTDALVGQDREHAAYLMTRKAPLSLWLRYCWLRLLDVAGRVLHSRRQRVGNVFSEPLPMKPVAC